MDDTGAAIELATGVLARELGCRPEDITLSEVKPVTWPDSALGCPRPGMMYTQVITPGYQIRLAHAGKEYIMHTDRGHHAIHCPGGGIMHNEDATDS